MEKIISVRPLTNDYIDTYIEVGHKAYTQHYLHLWKNSDPTPYFEKSFTKPVLERDMDNFNVGLYIIYHKDLPVGILKLIYNAALHPYTDNAALLLQKIYILNEFSGVGIGKKVMDYVLNHAEKRNKKIVWLQSMAIGPALRFYLRNEFEIFKKCSHPSLQVLKSEREMLVLVKHLD